MKAQYTMVTIRLFLIILGLISLFPVATMASEKWPGVDETVIEKIAQEHGREAMEPLINTDQGDLLLFLFLMAGAIGGFVAGYSWRVLTQEREEQVAKGNGTIR